MRRAGRAARAAAIAATLAATGLLVVTVVPTLFGYGAAVVTSGSMGRAMPVGSVALTRMVDVAAVRPGDVVTFRRPGASTPVTHRVVGVKAGNGGYVLRTQGDAAGHADDARLLADGRIARVVRVVPAAGYVIRFAQTAAGWIVLFAIPIAGILRDRRKPQPLPA
jgi:signal peptidase